MTQWHEFGVKSCFETVLGGHVVGITSKIIWDLLGTKSGGMGAGRKWVEMQG